MLTRLPRSTSKLTFGMPPCLVRRRSRASAALRYCVGLTPNAEKARRHAARLGRSESGVSPMRWSAAVCSAWYAASRAGGVGPLASPCARITSPMISGRLEQGCITAKQDHQSGNPIWSSPSTRTELPHRITAGSRVTGRCGCRTSAVTRALISQPHSPPWPGTAVMRRRPDGVVRPADVEDRDSVVVDAEDVALPGRSRSWRPSQSVVR